MTISALLLFALFVCGALALPTYGDGTNIVLNIGDAVLSAQGNFHAAPGTNPDPLWHTPFTHKMTSPFVEGIKAKIQTLMDTLEISQEKSEALREFLDFLDSTDDTTHKDGQESAVENLSINVEKLQALLK